MVCLQELKSSDDTFPIADIEAAGYGAVWHGQKGFNGVAVLARGQDPVERQRGLAGDPEDEHSRYLECEVDGLVVASIYLPNGNPQPGPKFDYKLRWMERLADRARGAARRGSAGGAGGRLQRHPQRRRHLLGPRDGERCADAARKPRRAIARLLAQGWTDALRTRYPTGGVWTFWDYQAGAWQRDAGFRIDHLLLSPQAADRLRRCRRRQGVSRARKGQRPCADLGEAAVRRAWPLVGLLVAMTVVAAPALAADELLPRTPRARHAGLHRSPRAASRSRRRWPTGRSTGSRTSRTDTVLIGDTLVRIGV